MKRKKERERERAGEALTTNVDALPIDEGRRVGYDYGQNLSNDYAYDLIWCTTYLVIEHAYGDLASKK